MRFRILRLKRLPAVEMDTTNKKKRLKNAYPFGLCITKLFYDKLYQKLVLLILCKMFLNIKNKTIKPVALRFYFILTWNIVL